MTEDEREELIEKIAKAADIYNCEARAALAVAEPVIREECAKIAEDSMPYITTGDKARRGYAQAREKIAAAIREEKHD
jgi:hypothetical protein